MASVQSQEACPMCGSTESLRKNCSYESHVKTFEGCHNRGYWHVGSDKILKEKPHEPSKCEMVNHQFVKDNTEIPVATVVKDWVDDNNRHFTLLERAKGQTLEKAWPTLSGPEKERVAEDVAQCLQQLRKFQSSQMQSLEHKPLHTGLFFLQGTEASHGPFASETEIWDAFETTLAKVPKDIVDKIKTRMPCMAPYTFSHGSLYPENIMVHDGKLSAILGWGTAGYYPAWWEFTAMSVSYSPEEMEWKNLLREKMSDKYPEAREFYRDVIHLHLYPDLDNAGKERLAELMESAE